MLITAPIFLNCFSRGGSNILWNAFLTHPDVCSPLLETLEIFSTRLKKRRVEGYATALLSGQPRLFDQWNLAERRSLPPFVRTYIDRTLYRWKLKTVDDIDMRFKYENEPYTLDEVRRARLVAKNNNGLAFLSDVLLDMYPDASFVALVRDPIALFESHRRRGLAQSVDQFAAYYSRIAGRMLRDAERMDRYSIWRFEDFMADPVAAMPRLYAQVGLDAARVRKVRFKAKPHYQADGSHTTKYEAGRHYWFEPGQVHALLDPDINAYHIEQVEEAEKRALRRQLEPVMQALGYVVPIDAP